MNDSFFSTFSISAFDKKNKDWGIAIATNNLAVGASTIYVEPGVGTVVIQAETVPTYGIKGLEFLKNGLENSAIVTKLLENDKDKEERQIGIVNNIGAVFSYTGETVKEWYGYTGEKPGNNYLVLGNCLLNKDVLASVAQTFENTVGELGERLVAAIVAGQESGGQANGKRSAAVLTKKLSDNPWDFVNLRVDNSDNPFIDLHKLVEMFFGRKSINKARILIEEGSVEEGKILLDSNVNRIIGWTRQMLFVADTYALIGDVKASKYWLDKALSENPLWEPYLKYFKNLSKN